MANITQIKLSADNMPPFTKGPNYKVVYSHNSRIRTSSDEVQVTFCTLIDSVVDGETKLALEEQIAILLSPKNAKALFIALAQSITQIESQIGVIDIGASASVPEDLSH